mmetsp:Transcript_64114/g.137732  ORF Transcript_64114/g.137732 Transcript_64114/m.137732 type:complete len:250 (+) Transcript_64114:75-824(+)
MLVMDLPDGPPRSKVKEWSPVDRMLAAKRGSKTPSPKPPPLQAARDLPPLQRSAPSAPPPRTSCAGAQTQSWPTLISEALAPERSKSAALQSELKALRAELKEREDGVRAAGDQAAEEAERTRLALEEELAALRQANAEAMNGHEEERRRWDEERSQFQEEKRRWREEQRAWQEERQGLRHDASLVGELRGELEHRNDDICELRRNYKALQEESKALAQERDLLLERLETEQAEMMARVEKLERRGTRS